MQWMPEAIRDGIIVVLIISGPLVLAAAFIGLVVGVLQAATQVQEQTIGSALKIIGVFALIIFVGFWMYQYLNSYTARTLSTAFTFVPRQTLKAVPRDAFREDEFKQSFENEKVNLETAQKPIRVEPPPQLESDVEGGGIPPGVPYLGGQEVPESPDVSKIVPPKPPDPSTQVFKGDIPLAPLQELKPIDSFQIPAPDEAPASIDDGSNEETNLQINLVPGNPTTTNDDVDLWQRDETFSENTTHTQTQDKEDTDLESPSWVN